MATHMATPMVTFNNGDTYGYIFCSVYLLRCGVWPILMATLMDGDTNGDTYWFPIRYDLYL